jgi:gamma-glutamylcyclotransferase (GGCT)/AIG2-like uncharacterized protein YtfP
MRYKEFTPAPIYYFAYGMLTDPDNMPNAELIGAAELRNFKFEIMLYANVTSSPGDQVQGVLWNIERNLLGMLDKVEDCPWLYNRKTLPVFCNGKKYEAQVYTMTPTAREYHYGTLPKKEYVQSLVNGYRNVGIPLTQISDGLRAIPSIYNNDPSRRSINENTNFFQPKSINDLQDIKLFVENELEEINSQSFNVDDSESAQYKALEKDFKALTAIEYVINNNIKAFNKPELLNNSIFLYDYAEDDDRIGAIQIYIDGDVAECKWLGSYRSSGKRLLHDGLQLAKAKGAKQVKLTSKWGSEGFYKKFGLQQGDTTSNPIANTDNTEFGGILNEANMSPSSLKKFVQTANGKDVMVGFEAEMLVPNLESFDTERERIEDYSKNMPIPTSKNPMIQIQDWYMDGDNPDEHRWFNQKLVRFNHDFNEFVEEKFNDYTNTRAGQETLYKVIKMDRMSIEDPATDKDIQNDIADENGFYHDANFKIRNDFIKSTNYWPEFLESQHMETMKDFCMYYDLSWPYYKSPYTGTLTIEELEQDFVMETGFTATASREYHTAKRGPDVWIFEPDGSLEDKTNKSSGVELVSPPMPLAEIFQKLDTFWSWAKGRGITANKTCGFHVGVSLTNQMTYQIDKLKLLVFLGEEHILKTFGRLDNPYTRSTFDYMTVGLMNTNLDRAIPILRDGLEKIANHYFLQKWSVGDTRHYSINVKPSYIEFRLAGGNYFDKKDEIINTIMRYVKAMVIAADPQAEKNEYAKKLYKLLTQNSSDDNEAVNVFAKYVSGYYTIDELKERLYIIRHDKFLGRIK